MRDARNGVHEAFRWWLSRLSTLGRAVQWLEAAVIHQVLQEVTRNWVSVMASFFPTSRGCTQASHQRASLRGLKGKERRVGLSEPTSSELTNETATWP